jgi:putative transposase
MPVSKKKPTTLTSEGSTQESSSPALPEQEDFRQYLRRLAVSAIQVLIEHVMCEELDESHRSVLGGMHAPSAVGIAMGPTV